MSETRKYWVYGPPVLKEMSEMKNGDIFKMEKCDGDDERDWYSEHQLYICTSDAKVFSPKENESEEYATHEILALKLIEAPVYD